MNGDILTDIRFPDLIARHEQKNAIATVATYQRDVNIDFGVLERDETQRITAFREKPTFHFDVSMGVYVFSKKILSYVPEGEPFGFDQLDVCPHCKKGSSLQFPPRRLLAGHRAGRMIMPGQSRSLRVPGSVPSIRVLVTGSAGFTGNRMMEYLAVQEDTEPVGLIRRAGFRRGTG